MQKTLTIGDATLTIRAVESDGAWVAEARREPSGMRVGPPVRAARADEAIERLERWLAWQRSHEQALADLQAAEREYYRAIAGSAFASGLAEATDVQQEWLRRVEEARVRLETIREARPEV